jgi:thiamine kinase-like enzyme
LTQEQLIQRLTAPLSLSPNAIIFELPGGTINESYLLNDSDADYMVKRFIGTDEFAIDRQDRFLLQQRLATRKLAPKPLFLDKEQGIYVEQWVHLTKQQIPLFFDEMHIDLLAKTLKRIHTCIFDLPIIDLPKAWQEYSDKLSYMSGVQKESLLALSHKWQALCDVSRSDNRLCHNDLAWAHIAGASQLILDWEYAGMGNRYFDLASCAKINQLDTFQTDLLIEKYAKHSKVDHQEVKEKTIQQFEFVNFTYDLWFDVLKQNLN